MMSLANQEKSTIEETRLKDVSDDKDGWRGWLVVTAASCSLFVYLGDIYSWGVLQTTLAATSSTSLTTLTFVGSLATSFMASFGIIAGILIRKYKHRPVAIAGAMLMGLGELLTSWATHTTAALFVTHGLIFGMGGGLTILACCTAPTPWFSKHKGLAIGVVFGGGSLGAAVMGVVSDVLVSHVGIEWTFRILALMLWGICLPAACAIRQPGDLGKALPTLQWQHFREKRFLIFFFGTALSCFPLFIPPYFIPIFVRSIADSNSLPMIALAVWNIASAIGRVFGGYTADTFLGPFNALVVALFLSGISALAIWTIAASTALLIVFTVLNGIGGGAFFSLVPTAVGAMYGPQNVLAILPIVWEGWFFGFFFGTPIASGLYSMSTTSGTTKPYLSAAYYCGAMSMIGMMLIIVVRFMQTHRLMTRV